MHTVVGAGRAGLGGRLGLVGVVGEAAGVEPSDAIAVGGARH